MSIIARVVYWAIFDRSSIGLKNALNFIHLYVEQRDRNRQTAVFFFISDSVLISSLVVKGVYLLFLLSSERVAGTVVEFLFFWVHIEVVKWSVGACRIVFRLMQGFWCFVYLSICSQKRGYLSDLLFKNAGVSINKISTRW